MMIANEAVTTAVSARVEEHSLAQGTGGVLGRLLGLGAVQLVEVDHLSRPAARRAQQQNQEQKSGGQQYGSHLVRRGSQSH